MGPPNKDLGVWIAPKLVDPHKRGSELLIFNWVYSLVFSAVQSIKLPINPRIIVIHLARVVASAAHSVGEIAENIENGNIEALVEEEVTSDILSHKTTKRKSVRN